MIAFHMNDIHQVFEHARGRLGAALRPMLSFELPPLAQLRRRKQTGWQRGLDGALGQAERLPEQAEEPRKQVEAGLQAGLEHAWGALLPASLVEPGLFQEAARRSNALDVASSEDRRDDLGGRVRKAAGELLSVQVRQTAPGFAAWLALGVLVTLVAGGLGYLYGRGSLESSLLLAGILTVVVGGLASLLGYWLFAAHRRGAELAQRRAELEQAWIGYRENTVLVVAHAQARAALTETLAQRAGRYAERQQLKHDWLHGEAPAERNLARTSLQALREQPVWEGRLPGTGREVVSLVAGEQVQRIIERWLTRSEEALLQLYGDYLRADAMRLRRWLDAEPASAFDGLRDWLVEHHAERLTQKTAHDAYTLDPVLGDARLRVIVQQEAACATSLDGGGLKQHLFVETGDRRLLSVIGRIFDRPALSEDGEPDEVRLLMLGPAQLTAEHLLAGTHARRQVLAKGGFWRYLPSPVLESMARSSGIVERLLRGGWRRRGDGEGEGGGNGKGPEDLDGDTPPGTDASQRREHAKAGTQEDEFAPSRDGPDAAGRGAPSA